MYSFPYFSLSFQAISAQSPFPYFILILTLFRVLWQPRWCLGLNAHCCVTFPRATLCEFLLAIPTCWSLPGFLFQIHLTGWQVHITESQILSTTPHLYTKANFDSRFSNYGTTHPCSAPSICAGNLEVSLHFSLPWKVFQVYHWNTPGILLPTSDFFSASSLSKSQFFHGLYYYYKLSTWYLFLVYHFWFYF